MSMFPFSYAAPDSLAELLDLLHVHGSEARVLAGGTDLVLRIRAGVDRPKWVLSLGKLKALRAITLDRSMGLTVGATALLAEVARHRGVNRHYHALAQGARATATVQVRNVGTVVGNLCNAAPCADNAPPLLALNAEMVIHSVRGRRQLPLCDFFKGPGETVLEPDEIVTAVRVPLPPQSSGSVFVPLSARSRVDMSAISVSAAVELEGSVCRQVRIAVGAAAPVPMRVRSAEKLLVDREFSVDLIARAATCVADEIDPISDIRASAAYRMAMAPVLTRRALEAAHRAALRRVHNQKEG